MLNQTQIKYAKLRLEALFSEKKKEIRDHFTIPEVKLSLEEKIEAIRNGEFEVNTSDTYYKEPLSRLKFYGERPSQFDSKSADAATKALSNEYTRILDQLILGDATEALEAINGFASIKIA